MRFTVIGVATACGLLLGGGAAAADSFVLVTYETPKDVAARTDAKAQAAYWARWSAVAGQMAQAGVLRGGSALQPAAKRIGAPAPKARSDLSGYFTIEAPGLVAAEGWAAKLKQAGAAAVEVRAVQANPSMTAPSAH